MRNKGKSNLLRLSLSLMVVIVFSGCIFTPLDPYVFDLSIEPDEATLDLGASRTFSVTAYDQFINPREVPEELSPPLWVIESDYDDFGILDATEGYEVTFTAANELPVDEEYMEGRIYVTMENEYGNTVSTYATIIVGTKPEE